MVSAERIAEIRKIVTNPYACVDQLHRDLLAEVERLTAELVARGRLFEELSEAQRVDLAEARAALDAPMKSAPPENLADARRQLALQWRATVRADDRVQSLSIRNSLLADQVTERDATITKLTADRESGVRPLRYPAGPDGVCRTPGCGNATVTDVYSTGAPFLTCESCYLAEDRAALDAEGQEPAAEPDARKLEFAEGKVTSTAGNVKSAGENPEPAAEPGCVNCGHEKSSHGEYLSMTQPPVKTECYYRSCRCTLFSPAAEGAGRTT
jgi:hypothetical protein